MELVNAHTSKDDAMAAERLLTAMSFEYDVLEQSASALHQQQVV